MLLCLTLKENKLTFYIQRFIQLLKIKIPEAMKTILVPADFSDASRNASIYAAEFGKILQCEVILFHTYVVPIAIASDIPTTIMMDSEVLKQETLDLLKKEAETVSEITGTKLSYEATEGDPVAEIIAAERNKKTASYRNGDARKRCTN